MSWFFWPSSSATSSATKPEVAHSSIPSSPDPTEFVSIEGQSPRRLSDAVLPSVSFRMTPNTPDRPQSMSRSDSMVDRIDKIDKPSSPARVELAGLESSADNVNQVNPSTSDSGLVDRIRDAGIHVLVTLMVWSSGWFGFSFAWTLLALLLYHVRRMHRDSSRQRQSASRQLALDEKLVIERNIGQLPNWVYFPDAERVEWLNRVIRQLWPFIELYVQKMLRDSLLPTLVSYLPDYMKGLRFETIDLGNIPLRIGSIKCHHERSSRKEVLLDVQLLYAGNSKLHVRCLRFGAGVKDIQLFGQLRVRLYPLFEQPPFFGAMSISFLAAPKIDFNLTSLADVLDWPGLSELIRRAVAEQLNAMLVYPNAHLINLSELPMQQLRFQPPAGVLRIELVEGRHLKKSDYGMLGLGKSDPYCNVYVAGHCFTTQVIGNTINPRWFFVCEAALGELDNQQIVIEVFDQDQGSSDDFLGRLTLSPHELDCNGQREYWMALEETETGQVLIRLTWLQLSEDLSLLNAQLEWRRRLHLRYGRTMDSLIRGGQSTVAKQSNTGSTEKNEYPYGSIFIVLLYLNSVRQLPLLGVNRQEPSVYVNIALDWRRRRSITIENTCNPMFEQSFHLLTGPISDQTPLRFELVNAVTGKTFGCAAIDLWQLIQSAQLTFDEPIAVRVDQCGECQLRVALELRLLTSNNRDPFSKVSSDSYDHHDYDHSPPSPRSVLHQASHESAVICEPDAPSQVPSLDEVIQSTVEPFVRTMQYDPISDSRPPFAQANKSASSLNKLVANACNGSRKSVAYKSGPNAEKSFTIELPKRNKNENPTVSPLRFQTVGFQMLSQFQPRILVTLDNLNNIYFKPLVVTVHKVINLHKVAAVKCCSRVKLTRYPGGRKKYRTRAIFNTNNPIYEQRFIMKHTEKKPLSQLQVLIVRGERHAFGPVHFTRYAGLARTVINLTDIIENNVTLWFELEWCV